MVNGRLIADSPPRTGARRAAPDSPDSDGCLPAIRNGMIGDKALDLALRHRLRKEVSLHCRATEKANDVDLLCGFHAFDHAIEFQVTTQVDHRLDDVAGGLLRRDIADETAVDLDLVERQLMDVAQAGLP